MNRLTLAILVKNFNRFRWVFCQLEALRHCLPPSVHRTLDEFLESLDETYERVLREIRKPNRNHARRLLQYLVVAIRPLGVEELAEILAVDFSDAEGIPKLNLNWRWEDQEQAVLTSCSSLIAIADTGGSRVVQFSHFSVKEYLTSTRIALPSGEFSRYHVDLEPAHSILAQSCIGIFLQTDDHAEENDVEKRSPLAKYAAEHWVSHAQFQSVSSSLRKAMEYLFDLDKPYFTAWLQIHDIDSGGQLSSLNSHSAGSRFGATPLYYAAMHFPRAHGEPGYEIPAACECSRWLPWDAAGRGIGEKAFQTAEFHHSGADMDVRGRKWRTPLHSAAWYGDLEMVRVLLNYKADVNARSDLGWTPIHYVSLGFSVIPDMCQSFPDVARLLLKHGADVNVEVSGSDGSGRTPLHLTMVFNRAEVVRVLLEHGANVNAEDGSGRTPSQIHQEKPHLLPRHKQQIYYHCVK